MAKKVSTRSKTKKKKLNNNYKALIVVLVVILLIFISFIAYNEWPLLFGKTVVLETRPVDPFDLFRGQYMDIRYEISEINTTESFEIGEKVYVELEEDLSGVSRQVDVHKTKPSDAIVIKGRVTKVYTNRIHIEYGIEQYFFERNAELPTENITIEARVACSGRARLKEMLHNGKPIEISYQNFSIKS